MGYTHKNKNNTGINAKLYEQGMEDGICPKHNKPFIITKGIKTYISKDDYVFTIGDDTEKCILDKELFEANTVKI